MFKTCQTKRGCPSTRMSLSTCTPSALSPSTHDKRPAEDGSARKRNKHLHFPLPFVCGRKGVIFGAGRRASDVFIISHFRSILGHMRSFWANGGGTQTSSLLHPQTWCTFRGGRYGLINTLPRVRNQVARHGDPQVNRSFWVAFLNLPLRMVPHAVIVAAEVGPLAWPREEAWFHVPVQPRNCLFPLAMCGLAFSRWDTNGRPEAATVICGRWDSAIAFPFIAPRQYTGPSYQRTAEFLLGRRRTSRPEPTGFTAAPVA